MPELPEIEHLRRTLEPHILGARVSSVRLTRRDIVHHSPSQGRLLHKRDLLVGSTIRAVNRHGKNLIFESDAGSVLCLHMGMSGHLRVVHYGQRISPRTHVHCQWRLMRNGEVVRLIFSDPRRFGGIWTFASLEDLHARRLSQLGPDALSISADALQERIGGSSRSIKTVLLDQQVLAGVGNIYADEALHRAGLHPLTRADRITTDRIGQLRKSIWQVLTAAIESGGSTIRSYADGNGKAGEYSRIHQVYGRAGKPCLRCGENLVHITVAQRTTTFCRACQVRR